MIFILVLVLIACYELFEHRASKHIGDSPPVVVTGVSENRPLPDVTLTDASGKTTSMAALHGKLVVLAPFATLCTASCAATTSAFAQLEAELRTAGYAHKVTLVELSVDPANDSPARLASFAKLTGASWMLMSGSPAQVSQLWSALGQYYQVGKATTEVPRDAIAGGPASYGVTYANAVYFLGTDGNLKIADYAAPAAALDSGAKQLVGLEGVLPSSAGTAGWTVSQAFGNIEEIFNRRIPL